MGFSFITGQETVMHADNASFDGTERAGRLLLDGQLWIGSTALPHVVKNTLTAGTGISITNGPGSITIANTGPSTDLHVARYIVSAGGAANGANYTSITTAYAAAVAAAAPQTVFIQPGTYTENITLTPGINLCAFECDALTPTVTIVGTCTLTTAGTVTISGIRLQTNSAPLLAVTGSAASIVNLVNCYLNCTNNTGITFSSSSGSAEININYCQGNIGTTGISLVTSTSAGGIDLFYSTITNSGGSSTASTASVSGIRPMFSEIFFPVTTSGTGFLGCFYASMDTSGTNTTCATLGGSGASNQEFSKFSSGSASAISFGASGNGNVSNCLINSSNTNAITGAGSIGINNITFANSSLINTTTQTVQTISNNAITVKSPGAYPYTTVAQDTVILVDTSSARTIVPRASPVRGENYVIKDSVGSAAANNITITPSGKNIDGAASSTINIAYGAVKIVYNGTEWSII